MAEDDQWDDADDQWDQEELERVLAQYDDPPVPSSRKRSLAPDGNARPSPPYYRLLVAETRPPITTAQTFMATRLPLGSHSESETIADDLVIVVLEGGWAATQLTQGMIVHVGGTCHQTANELHVTDQHGFIVLHPDTLLSSTQVADSFTCLRRSVLASRFKAPGESNVHLLYGCLLHEIFQAALLANDFTDKFMAQCVHKLVRQNIETIYCIGETEAAVEERLLDSSRNFRLFQERFLADFPRDVGVVQVHRSYDKVKHTQCVSKLLDIEENIWSPMFGLKGKVDVSAQTCYTDKNGVVLTKVTPLELKTGKSVSNLSHRAQTALYTLLMTDRYSVPVDQGLLYYCKTNDVFRIPAMRDEIRGLLMSRNEMVSFIVDRNKLPPVLQSIHSCRHCSLLDICMTYHKTYEEGTIASAGIGTLFNVKTDMITAQHEQFLKRWNGLIEMEENATKSQLSDIWTMSSQDRATKYGKCFNRMRVDKQLPSTVGASTICSYQYRMKCDEAVCLTKSNITIGDSIVVSSESGQIALAAGFVMMVESDFVVVALDRQLRGVPARSHNFDPVTNQNYHGLVSFGTGRPHYAHNSNEEQHCQLYRIDKTEMFSGMGQSRFNVFNLFLAGGDSRRRELVVDLCPPKFSNIVSTGPVNIHQPAGLELNEDQLCALEKVFAAEDYALLLGMPGTGKTATIAALIAAMVVMGKSVLVTAYTHSAVDNILIKLSKLKVPFLRLGNIDRIHPDMRPFTIGGGEPVETVAQLDALYNSHSVIGTTCLGVGHPLLTKRQFDVCIVDEASQITLPTCLGPLRCAKTFVLVGDHNQLPPVVQSAQAREGGFDVSLFKLLSDAHPAAVITLKMQYRMNGDIMSLANHLFYNNQLRCGSSTIETSVLHLKSATVAKVKRWQCPLNNSRQSIVFFDTDEVNAGELKIGDRIQNQAEVCIVNKIVTFLVRRGRVAEKDLGVISQYRSQLHLLADHLKSFAEIEILTVDRFQGRDKQCILISFVRSNPQGQIGDLLQDWRRLNVALTRAKTKLIMVGSRRTLGSNSLYRRMLDKLQERDWIYPLQPCDGLHSAADDQENITLMPDPRHASKQRTLVSIDDKENVFFKQ